MICDNVFKILFGKFTSRHRSTLLCAKFVKIVRREIGEIVRYLSDKQTKTKSRLPLKLATAQIAPEVCRG